MEFCKESEELVVSKIRSIALVVLVAVGCGCDPKHPEPDVDPSTAPPGFDQERYSRFDEIGQACTILEFLKCPEFDAMTNCNQDLSTLVELNTFQRSNILCIRVSRSKEKIRRCDVDCQ